MPFFYIIIYSPILSNIFQHNAKMFKEKYNEMQRRYEEEQQLQVYLKEAAKTFCVECATQKTRKVAETKIREEAEK